MSNLPSKNYKDYEITPWTDGFCKYFLNKSGSIGNFDLGLIATYVVRKHDAVILVGFAVGGLDLFAEPNHPKFKQETLVKQAESVIKRYIDSDAIKDKKQLTFEFHSNDFLPVTKPEWWTKQITV